MTTSIMARIVKLRQPAEEPLLSVTVQLTAAELAALSWVAVVVTSCGESAVINAADRGLRKIREAAAKHPDLPTSIKERQQ